MGVGVRMSSSEFTFPWQYSFPPFFTLQPHAETRAKQLSAWRSLVLDYCQHGGIAAVDVADLARSPLFRNDAIGRRLDDKGGGHRTLRLSATKSNTMCYVQGWAKRKQWP